MSTTTHPSAPAGTSQCDLILAALLMAPQGQWVSVLHLHNISGSLAVHSRIADLRQRGHAIQHKNEHPEGGKVHSYYRLAAPPLATGMVPGEMPGQGADTHDETPVASGAEEMVPGEIPGPVESKAPCTRERLSALCPALHETNLCAPHN